jgi:hypothetical protein
MTKLFFRIFITALLTMTISSDLAAEKTKEKFRAIAFYTARADYAHISFVHEAHKWFSKMADENSFQYDSTDNWDNLNENFLSQYRVVIFLDTRPDSLNHRLAFQKYMENGGAWLGFHFAGFALTPSAFPQNWDWYHDTFLGVGEYRSNTWRPTSAVLRMEDQKHPVMKGLPITFNSAPCEWYRWENDIRENPDIKILVSIDPTSFPIGTGPKQHEIWHEGYYPVVWTNTKYKMLYLNMGHNDMDYEGGTRKSLSSTFSSEEQNKLILQSLLWLGKK